MDQLTNQKRTNGGITLWPRVSLISSLIDVNRKRRVIQGAYMSNENPCYVKDLAPSKVKESQTAGVGINSLTDLDCTKRLTTV